MRSNSRGQALTEFALAATILLTLLVGVAQVAVIYFALVAVDTAAREGARVASEQPGNTTTFSSPLAGGSHTCTTASSEPNACKAVYNSTRSALGGLIKESNLNTTIVASVFPGAWPPAACAQPPKGPSDGFVTVRVAYDVPIFVPIVGSLLSTGGTNHRTVASTVEMRVEPCINTNNGS